MTTLTKFSAYLGKYFSELFYSASQEKYKGSCLNDLFDQRYSHQANAVQFILDPRLSGLSLEISGNEIYFSEQLYNHPSISIVNSVDVDQKLNPKSLYSAENFGSVSYLACPNQLTLRVTESVQEPIYVKYTGDFECFYHSVAFFYVEENVKLDIVEEFESLCALSAVCNYVISPNANLVLNTFYKNNISASSVVYRNVVSQENSQFTHKMLGRSSAGILDETKLHPYRNSINRFIGIVDSKIGKFHTIVYVEPIDHNYRIDVKYKNLSTTNSVVTFYPVIVGQEPNDGGASITVEDFDLNQVTESFKKTEIINFINDILPEFNVTYLSGTIRYYKNKNNFISFP